MRRSDTNAPESAPAEVTIEKWAYGGKGLARIEGQVVLVPLVLPGERVRVQPERRRSGMLEASLAEIVSPSPDRVEPPCRHFGVCGGCHYQHAPYVIQIVRKADVLREVLQRVGKLEAPGPIGIVASASLGYRNRAQFHIRNGEAGYLEGGSHRLRVIDECPICSPGINSALGALGAMLRDRRFPSFLRTIEFFTNESETQVNVVDSERPVARRFFEWCAEQIPGYVPGSLEYKAGGELYRVSGGSFFQVNRFLTEALVEVALDNCRGDVALDLYAGVGLFTLPLARRFEAVTAVESGASAARDLAFNAERAGVEVEVERGLVAGKLAKFSRRPDFVLADPPRAGLGPAVVAELLRLKPRRLVLISCEPATLARDLASLAAGGYKIEQITVVDLFPQTYHIETVTKLGLTD